MVSLRRPFLVLGQTCFWVLSIIGVELPLHVPGSAPPPPEEFARRPSDVFGALPPQAPRDRLWCRERVQEALHQALHVRFLPSPGHRASERRGEGSRRALDNRVESYYPGGVPVPPPPEGRVAQYLRDSSGQDARAHEGVERPLEGRGPWGARGASVFAEQDQDEQKDY